MREEKQTDEQLRVPSLHRFRVALCSLGLSIEKAAEPAGVCGGHLYQVLHGQRIPSQRLLQRLRGILGPAAWAYALGESDVLPCPEQKPAPLPAPAEQRAAA